MRKLLFVILVGLCVSSCGFYSEMLFELVQYRVRSSTPFIQRTLLELAYIKKYHPSFGLGRTVEVLPMTNQEGTHYVVWLILSSGTTMPGHSVGILYLTDSDGNILDWKTLWRYTAMLTGVVYLTYSVRDLNENGLPEIILCDQRVYDQQEVAAYEIGGDKFIQTMGKETLSFPLSFGENMSHGPLEIVPMFSARSSYEINKLHKIPIILRNTGKTPVDLHDKYLTINYETSQGVNLFFTLSEGVWKDELLPGEEIEVPICFMGEGDREEDYIITLTIEDKVSSSCLEE